jgi:hypothetical protein
MQRVRYKTLLQAICRKNLYNFICSEAALQIITADSSINLDNFTIKDISHLPQADRAQEIIKIQQLDRKVPFDLSTPGLMRFTVIKQHANLVTVMQTTHHSISANQLAW